MGRNSILEDAIYIITGEQAADRQEGVTIEVELEDDCDFCGGLGLAAGFCPACGKWDIRTDDEIADGDPNEEFLIV